MVSRPSGSRSRPDRCRSWAARPSPSGTSGREQALPRRRPAWGKALLPPVREPGKYHGSAKGENPVLSEEDGVLRDKVPTGGRSVPPEDGPRIRARGHV